MTNRFVAKLAKLLFKISEVKLLGGIKFDNLQRETIETKYHHSVQSA